MSLARVEGFPRNFGAYLLLSSLGRGGMGEVFLAKKRAVKDIDRLCIVKTLRGDLAEHQEYVRRFLDEARIVVQLNHSNICQVYEAGKVNTDFFLAMEYIPGVNIKDLVGDLLQGGEVLPTGIALWMGEQICEALGYAHRLKSPVSGEHLRVIHRDVSPANVMVSFEGEVKLIDFGLAESVLKTEQTETRLVMGKVAYMSPEQARGEDIDGTTDQFAAAVVTYEMLAGDRFYGDYNTHQVWQVVGTGAHVARRWSTLDERVRSVLARAMSPQPNKRFPTCEAFGAALDDVRAQIDPRASRNQLRELMKRLYGDRAAAEHDVIASFSDLRAPDAFDAFSPPPTQPGEDESGAQPVVEGTDKSPRARKGWGANTDPWQSSPSESGGQPTSAVRRSPGEAVSAPPPELTMKDAPRKDGGPISSDAATRKRAAVTSLPPDMTMSSPSSPGNVARDTTIIARQSAERGAGQPANNLGRGLVAGAIAAAVLAAALFVMNRSERAAANSIVDAGSIAVAVVDAGSVAVAVVDAGRIAAAVAPVIEADAGTTQRIARVEGKKPRDTKVNKPVDTPIDTKVDTKVDTPVITPVDAGTAVDPADIPVNSFTAYEVVDILERCVNRVGCAAKTMELSKFKNGSPEAQRDVGKFCAKSCVKAGVPRSP